MINLAAIQADKKKLLIFAIIGVAALYLDFSLVLKAQISSLNDLRPKTAKLKSDLAKLDSDLIKMKESKGKQAESDKKAQAKIKKILFEDQVTSFMQTISDVANNDQIKILQIKPHKEVVAVKTEKAGTNDKMASLLINLELNAGYHDFGKFLNDLENGEIFVTVHSLKIAETDSNYNTQKINLTLKTYVRK